MEPKINTEDNTKAKISIAESVMGNKYTNGVKRGIKAIDRTNGLYSELNTEIKQVSEMFNLNISDDVKICVKGSAEELVFKKAGINFLGFIKKHQ